MNIYLKVFTFYIYSQPYIKPKLIGEIFGITSRTTLTKYFSELVDARILSSGKIGRDVYYINDDLSCVFILTVFSAVFLPNVVYSFLPKTLHC